MQLPDSHLTSKLQMLLSHCLTLVSWVQCRRGLCIAIAALLPNITSRGAVSRIKPLCRFSVSGPPNDGRQFTSRFQGISLYKPSTQRPWINPSTNKWGRKINPPHLLLLDLLRSSLTSRTKSTALILPYLGSIHRRRALTDPSILIPGLCPWIPLGKPHLTLLAHNQSEPKHPRIRYPALAHR